MMENDEQTLNSLETSFKIDQLPKQLDLSCSRGNQAYSYCFNQKCQHQNIFLCGLRKCKCHQSHSLCCQASIDYTLLHINSKIIKTTQIKEYVDNQFEKFIEHLSQIKENIIKQIDSKFKYSMLKKVQRKFMDLINLSSKQNLTTKQSAELWKIINKQYQGQFDIIAQLKSQIKKFQQSVSQFKAKTSSIITKQQLLFEISPFHQHILLKSSIFNRYGEIQMMRKMLPKNEFQAKLIFKASEHQFSISKYYQMCGSEQSTIIICKTNKDKIIGGYTPLSFNPKIIRRNYYNQEYEDGYTNDSSNCSLLFSISQNNIFKLKVSSKAIYRYRNKNGIQMGENEFYICDKANLENKCITNLENQTYDKKNYKNSKESYLQINGNQSCYFSTKEWEVWKIKFNQ